MEKQWEIDIKRVSIVAVDNFNEAVKKTYDEAKKVCKTYGELKVSLERISNNIKAMPDMGYAGEMYSRAFMEFLESDIGQIKIDNSSDIH